MASAPPTGLRAQKRIATRRALAEHALALFAARGFDAVTVEEVAAAAGVSPRTAYRHIDGKDDLLFTDDEAIAVLVLDAVTTVPPGDPRADVRAAGRAFAAWCAPRRRALRERDAVIRATPALCARELAKRAALEELFTATLGARAGVDPERDVRPRVWARTGLGCADAAYRLWLARGGDLTAHLDAAYDATRL